MITNRIYNISGFLIVKAKQAMPNIPLPSPHHPRTIPTNKHAEQ